MQRAERLKTIRLALPLSSPSTKAGQLHDLIDTQPSSGKTPTDRSHARVQQVAEPSGTRNGN
jgi:hypothetical protein